MDFIALNPTLGVDDEVEVVVELSEEVEDELLEDFDNDVDTLTLTFGRSLSSFTLSSLDSGSSLFKENGPKGILTKGVVVDSLEVDGLGVFLVVGLN